MSTPDANPERTSSLTDENAIVDQAAFWFARLRSEPLSPADRRAFEAWRDQHPFHEQAYREVCNVWEDPALKAAAVESTRVSSGTQPYGGSHEASRRRLNRLAAAAAIAGLVTAVGLLLDLPIRLTADYRTATGDRRVVQLSDQSTVTLNTYSAIATDLDGDQRRIHLLRGEAFFQVHPDQQRPFVVDHHQILARAVGTEFLVREEPQGILVTVVEGVVELSPTTAGWHPIQLTAGQQVLVDTKGAGSPRTIDLHAATGWVRGRLIFDNVRLADVVDEIRRYHTGVIVFWNPAVGDLRVSGSYTLSDATDILTTLARTLPIHLTRLTDNLVVLF